MLRAERSSGSTRSILSWSARTAFSALWATSNPIIVSDLIKSGRFDQRLDELVQQGLSDSEIAWDLTDGLVRDAQQVFLPAWDESRGNDGYVSFELDPLLEDPKTGPPHKDASPNTSSWDASGRPAIATE